MRGCSEKRKIMGNAFCPIMTLVMSHPKLKATLSCDLSPKYIIHTYENSCKSCLEYVICNSCNQISPNHRKFQWLNKCFLFFLFF